MTAHREQKRLDVGWECNLFRPHAGLAASFFLGLLLLTGCGSKTTHAPAGKINVTVLCSSLAEKPTGYVPSEIAGLFIPVNTGDAEYYPNISIQRIDVLPTPAPISSAVNSTVGRSVETMLGTWNPAKELRAAHLQIARTPVGKAYSDEADATKRPWDVALSDAVPRYRAKAVFALDPSSDPTSNRVLTIGALSIPILPNAAAVREALKRSLPAPGSANTRAGKAPEYLVVYLGSGASATASATPAPDASRQDLAAAATLRLHGSNTIGSALAPALLEEFLKRENATNIRRIATDDPLQTIIQAALPGQAKEQIFEVSAHGSKTAFIDLPREQCEIGMSSRRITPEEAQACATAGFGNMYSQNCEHILGLDGIAIIINHNNNVPSLSKEQLAGIFSGSIKDWREVGGSPGFIVVYARDESSGTFDTFRALVLAGANLVSTAHRVADNKELSSRVANDPMAIGFVGRPFIGDNKAVPISDKGTIPFVPNRFTISTEDYPLSRRLYLYTPANPPNPLVRKFIEYALADNDGQELVVRTGFVAVGKTPVAQPVAVPRQAPPEYVRETQNASRLDLNFRFRTGSSELDSKAIRDLDRVAGLLRAPEYTGKYLLLFGFADSTGTQPQNLALSKERARAVGRELQTRGIVPSVISGFGQDLPISSNDTPEGKEKNRRVEVWVRDR
jgi:phosphate transport system substrate-binding protein